MKLKRDVHFVCIQIKTGLQPTGISGLALRVQGCIDVRDFELEEAKPEKVRRKGVFAREFHVSSEDLVASFARDGVVIGPLRLLALQHYSHIRPQATRPIIMRVGDYVR
jgi:hypothetical protein